MRKKALERYRCIDWENSHRAICVISLTMNANRKSTRENVYRIQNLNKNPKKNKDSEKETQRIKKNEKKSKKILLQKKLYREKIINNMIHI